MLSHLLLLASLGTLGTSAAPLQDSKKKAIEAESRPYDLPRLIGKFDIIRRNRYALNENILKAQLKKDGISFHPTQEDLKLLKKAGATDDFLKFVVTLRPVAKEPEAPPPPPAVVVPPKPKEGTVKLTCKPVDCEVTINGQQRGRTKEGVLTLEHVPEGAIKVAVAAKDHAPDRDAHNAFVKDGDVIPVDFAFKPTPAALEALGRQLITKMLEALGGENGVKEMQRVRTSGGQLLWSKGNSSPTTWFFTAYLKLPDQAKFVIGRGGQQLEIFKLDAGFGPLPKDKSEELEEALRDFYGFQFARTLDRLFGPGQKRVASKLLFKDGESPVVRIEGGPESYLVTLDTQNLPKEVKLESSGLTNGLRIQYGEYLKTGGTFYPKYQHIGWPGTPSRGTEIRIETASAGADAVKDADLVNKKAKKGRK